MDEIGTVERTSGNKAEVRFEKSEACQSCKACRVASDGSMKVEVINPIGAKEGDRVKCKIEGSAVVKAAFLVYGVSLIALFFGLFIGLKVMKLTQGGALVVALTFMALSFIFIRCYGARKGDYYTSTIVDIITIGGG